ncbi:ABC transporter permease [Streptosporangium sp. 'caverna']|uniref:ABC transporter permease n=1 Tax=Streptosporangium sp. 'caverna' TaxID=2202249 RepID=UPI000D7D3EEA|nr:ABC transporter permease [Streptosporangium sp. 'caverna']AWS46975.1 ABC transporter permease [Streptosporangium sp. 'caverna']
MRRGNQTEIRRSRLLRSDVYRVGASGLSSRPTRVILSALGIAIGIAAMIAVVGISTSSRAKLDAQLASLGTNLLTVQPGTSFTGEDTSLPVESTGKVGLIRGVEKAGAVAALPDVNVYRNRLIDPGKSGGIDVQAAGLDLLSLLDGTLREGTWLTEATASYPTVVLGGITAERLGIVSTGSQVWLGDTQVTVIGILDALPLAPELDTSAFIGEAFATSRFGWDGKPTVIFERSADAEVEAVRDLLPRTVNPENPENVSVSRPSDALAAKNAADLAFTGLLVGLGSVALLVGGIGVANTMVISVLERRREIGLRRALGATRGHIRTQFLAEALLLSALGGLAGTALGFGVIAVFAETNGWPISVPPAVFAGGIGATMLIGAVAGLYPAIRAARTPPTAALNG